MPNSDQNNMSLARRLIPVARFNAFHPDPSPAALRWLIFKNKDGFNRCVVRRGRRVLIDEAEYFKWISEHNDKGSWRARKLPS